ncbi:MAG: hypothetical protein ACYS1A_07330 [Planctomycetota bacterium]|jgi:hypothetical protein
MFWFAVLVGVLLAVVGIKAGFYSMWAVVFNILISIYLGVMLCPTIIGLVPDIGDSRYHHGGCVGGVAVVVFAIFQTITVNFLTGAETVKKDEEPICFPKMFNIIGAGLLGFLSGYIVCGFVLFVLLIMPISKEPIVKDFCEQSGFAAQSVKNVCGFVGSVSLQTYEEADPREVVDWLMTVPEAEKSRRVETEKNRAKKIRTEEPGT